MLSNRSKQVARCKQIALKSVAAGEARAYDVVNNVLAYVHDHYDDMGTQLLADFVQTALADVKHPARSYVSPKNLGERPVPKDIQMDRFLAMFSVKF